MKILTNKLKPNPTQIYLISRALDKTIKEFYKNPDNERAFLEWKSKKETQNGNGTNSGRN